MKDGLEPISPVWYLPSLLLGLVLKQKQWRGFRVRAHEQCARRIESTHGQQFPDLSMVDDVRF